MPSLGPDKPRLRVLLVDDDIEETSALRGWLETAGCRTAISFGTATAAPISALFHPHLVLVGTPTGDAQCAVVLQALRAVERAGWHTVYVRLDEAGSSGMEPSSADDPWDAHVARPVEPARLAELLASRWAALAAARLVIGQSLLAPQGERRRRDR